MGGFFFRRAPACHVPYPDIVGSRDGAASIERKRHEGNLISMPFERVQDFPLGRSRTLAPCQWEEPAAAGRTSSVMASALPTSIWPFSVRRHSPLATSHTLSVLSLEAQTIHPSIVSATSFTSPVWPCRLRSALRSPRPTP